MAKLVVFQPNHGGDSSNEPRESRMRLMMYRRVLLLGLLALTMLSGCGTERFAAAPQIQSRPRLPWQAAIGEVHTNAPNVHCSGVLVAPDTIATAAHCLFLETAKRPASPNEIVFRPNGGGLPALPPSRGIAIKALGAPIRGGRLRNEDVSKDWMLVQISPPVTAVQPIAVARLTIEGMLEMIGSGNRLVIAGYGNGAHDQLNVNEKCRLLSQKELGLFLDDSWLQLDCIIRIGDSGGGIILLDGAGQPALVGLVAGLGRNPKSWTVPMGLGVNASQFLPHLRPVISSLPAPTDLADLPLN
jgi:protease YdgD